MTPTYTHGHTEPVLRSHRWRTVQNSAAYLLPHLQPEGLLLDVGSGPGTITADLAHRVGPRNLVAVERTVDAATLTRAELDRQQLTGSGIVVGDVQAMGFATGTFAVVHAHQVLQHVADPVLALSEMLRVCAPGGVIAARDADYSSFAWYPRHPALDEWMQLYQEVARGNGGEPDAGRHLHSWARAAGAAAVHTSVDTWLYTGADAIWWGNLWADRMISGDFAVSAQERGLISMAGLRRVAECWREWAQDPDAWFALLHGEIICRSEA